MNITPDCSQIMKLADDYKRIPVCREVFADVVTPITLLRRIAGSSSRFFLLESIEGGETWGRYSFLGFDPIMRVTCKQALVTIEDSTGEAPVIRTVHTNQPLNLIREILNDYKAPKIEGLPPFAGGFVGYFAYAMMGYAEPTLKIKEHDCNDYDLMLFDKVIAYDHLKQKISIVVNMKTDHVMEEYGAACTKLEALAKLIADSSPLEKSLSFDKPEFTCNVSKEEYCRMVEKTKEYIVDGDIFQAVISRQFVSDYEGTLLNAYRVLRTTNPSPYMVYMKCYSLVYLNQNPQFFSKLNKVWDILI